LKQNKFLYSKIIRYMYPPSNMFINWSRNC